MKKIVILVVTVFITLQLQAQDTDLLNRIRAINGKILSFEADLANSMVKPKKTNSQEGKLYFVKPYEFAAQFTTGKYMMVNQKKINMEIGIFSGTYKLRDGGMMQSLANIFLYGFQGKAQELADENGYNLTLKTEDGFHVVTMTVKRKKLIGIGYKQVVFKYFTDSLLLKEIILFDYSGNMDVYTISNVKYDVPVDQNLFAF